MAKISIEPKKAKKALAEQAELEKTLRTLCQDVRSVQSGLNFKIAGQQAISTRLRTAAEQIEKEANGTKAMYTGLEEVIRRYEQTEKGNTERIPPKKADGDKDPSGNQLLARIKALLSLADKTKTSDISGLGKDGISYLESLYKFLTGDKRGLTGAEDWFDLGDKSIGIWTEFYDYLKILYNEHGDTFSLKNQRSVAGLEITGGFLGLFSSIFGMADYISNTEDIGPAGIMGEILGGGDDVVDIWSGAEKLKHMGDTATNITTKNGLYSPLSFYSAIAKGYLSAASQGFKSYEKYATDGSWDSNDAAKTGVEFGVSGLYSMVDALTFGLLSDKTTGITSDDISGFLENWAADIGKQAGNYLRNNPTLRNVYDHSGFLGKVAIAFYSAART